MSNTKKKPALRRSDPDYRWILFIFFSTVLISAVMSLVSSRLLGHSGIAVSCMIVVCIIMLGIVFDIIGIAVTRADEAPFHAMASRKIPEAADAIMLIRNAGRVSSFCNDVIGDICGVISGAASAAIVARILILRPDGSELWLDLVFSALVAGLTVGGKAFGKTFAIQSSTNVVRSTARILCFFRTLRKRLRRK